MVLLLRLLLVMLQIAVVVALSLVQGTLIHVPLTGACMGRVRDKHVTRIVIWGRDWLPSSAGRILVVKRAIVERLLRRTSLAAIRDVISTRAICSSSMCQSLSRSSSFSLASCYTALAARICSRRGITTVRSLVAGAAPAVIVSLAIAGCALYTFPNCPICKVPLCVFLALSRLR